MSWESIFKNINSVIQLITLIGPIIDFVEALFKRFFPGQKKGEIKKQVATSAVMLMTKGDTPIDLVEDVIDALVAEKNRTGEFTHTILETDLKTNLA